MKDTSVSALLRKAHKGKPFINQRKFHIRSYIKPPVKKKECCRKPRLKRRVMI